MYTSILGGYERLNEDQSQSSDIDFVCFTDDPELTSDVWDIVHVSPAFPLDPHRSQRRVKILGHARLNQYRESMYIDNTVSLRGEVNELFETMLGDADMGMAHHSYHSQLHEEFAAVWSAGIDDYHRLMEQWDHYTALSPEALGGPALWGGIIVRRNTTDVKALCETWYEHVLRYSRRDQLSVPVAVLLHPNVKFAMRELDNFRSPWHEWPVVLERKVQMRAGMSAVRVPRDLSELVSAYDRTIAMEQRLAAQAAELESLTQSIAKIHSSRSWRVTAPLRKLRQRLETKS